LDGTDIRAVTHHDLRAKIGYTPLLFAMGASLLSLTVPRFGLICEGRDQRGRIPVPLADVEAKRNDANQRIVSDYSSWFTNYR